MNKTSGLGCLASALLLAPWPTPAQTPSLGDIATDQQKPLNKLKLEFDIERAELMKPLAELDQLYRAQLEKLRLEAQGRGRLAQVIAVQAELAKLGEPAPEEAGEDFSDLAKARSIYGKARREREDALHRGLLALITKQRPLLVELRTAQTRQNQLDAATGTNTELATLLALEEQTRRRADPPPAAKRALEGATRVRGLKVRVQVDGTCQLHLTGDEIWFDHTRGQGMPPGRHQGKFPTYLNDKTEWNPVWDGRVTERHPIALDLSLAGARSEVRLHQSSGRGFAEIVQQPEPANGYTLVIELRDETHEGLAFDGSDWMEFRLAW